MSNKSENVVFIGQKPPMSYVMAVFEIVNKGIKEIVLKARGRAISRAVDVAEIARTKVMKDKIEVKEIVTGTEMIESKDRGKFSVSTIEITLKQK
ncbi:MAG: DNA-binding protein Alba [Candidatus Helarchaeota archaeon]